MDNTLRHRVNAGRHAVKNQIDFFNHQFGQVRSDWKEDDTRVTFMDFAISEKIFTELRGSFPDDDYCSEESNPQDEVLELKSKYAWVLDPVDGTNNYALGFPTCAISLALLKNGVPVYGFIYDHSRRILLQGGPEEGVYAGSHRCVVKPTAMDKHSIIGMHFPLTPEQHKQAYPIIEELRVRSIGSGALSLAYAATGMMDGALDFRVKVWDIAAGYALMLGAGGQFRFLEQDIFPLETFHVRQPNCPYAAGTPSFMERIAECFPPVA